MELGDVLLDVRGLSRAGEFSDVSFTVRAGEIVGLAGLVGSGRSEVLETIFGARKPDSGVVTVDGKPLRPGSVASAVNAGIGLAPEERKSQALLLDMSVTHNVTLASLDRYSKFGFSLRDKEFRDSLATLERLDLRPIEPDRPVGTLSGGNQQKAVVARWLVHGCRVLLLDEPTRGVDVGARAELYRLMHATASGGRWCWSQRDPRCSVWPTGCRDAGRQVLTGRPAAELPKRTSSTWSWKGRGVTRRSTDRRRGPGARARGVDKPSTCGSSD